MKKNNSNKDVETCMAELEDIADKLASGDIKIEEAMALYKQGMTLVEYAQKILSRYEQEVEFIEN